LLDTKRRVPRRRRDSVARSRLVERLRRGQASALTLVSAPAGFGKTTLLTDWLATEDDTGAAWLSLDDRDNDPALFWGSVIAALQVVVPEVGADAQELLATPGSTEAVLVTLLNELGAVGDDLVLVLDDYHVIESPEIQEGVAFLLEHLPPHVRLVIASRADPALPLARLRARGELVELRAADLRFSTDEAATYLGATMGLELTADDVAALESRTEGWIAALQLAALSMQGRDDAAGFIAGFAGDDRYVVDYLAGEVLARQPEDVRRFLLETSVLSRLTGSLCDTVTGQTGGKATLEAIDRGNLFLVPLDDRRHWFRYHHLFADVLRARLLDEQPDRVPELHRRASGWYEHEGDGAEAFRHALAGGDVERAADLVERGAPELRRNRQEATLGSWIEALPEEVFARRPVLGIEGVGSLIGRGDPERVEQRLRDVESLLQAEAASPGSVVVADPTVLPRLPATIAMYRAGLARLADDGPATVAHAEEALAVAASDDHLVRGAAGTLRALAQWSAGDLGAAHESYEHAIVDMERAGHLADVLGLALGLADIQRSQGRLGAAMATFERGLALGTAGGSPLRGTADMHVGLADLYLERGDLEAAREQLEAGQELGEALGLPQHPHRWRVATARLREVEGDLDGAVTLLEEAAQRYDGDFLPDVRPIPALIARLWVRRGEVDRALAWAREQGLSVEDDLTYLRETEHLTLARALLAKGDDDVLPFLDRLLTAAEEGGRLGSTVEVLVLQARAGRPEVLDRARSLAEPEGYVQVFADGGAPPPAPAAARPRADLVEPLSERELDVLRLLRSELSGPEIARELIVSLNTVRTHTRHIYEKLGVSSRRAAVRRADELGL
jgi:LuxR family maltose regulon positive regulatory protein